MAYAGFGFPEHGGGFFDGEDVFDSDGEEGFYAGEALFDVCHILLFLMVDIFFSG